MKKFVLLSVVCFLCITTKLFAQEMPKFSSDEEKIQWVKENPEAYQKSIDVLKEESIQYKKDQELKRSPQKKEVKKYEGEIIDPADFEGKKSPYKKENNKVVKKEDPLMTNLRNKENTSKE